MIEVGWLEILLVVVTAISSIAGAVAFIIKQTGKNLNQYRDEARKDNESLREQNSNLLEQLQLDRENFKMKLERDFDVERAARQKLEGEMRDLEGQFNQLKGANAMLREKYHDTAHALEVANKQLGRDEITLNRIEAEKDELAALLRQREREHATAIKDLRLEMTSELGLVNSKLASVEGHNARLISENSFLQSKLKYYERNAKALMMV